MGRKKKIIVKAAPEVWHGPIYLKGSCNTCPCFTFCRFQKIKDANERYQAKLKDCELFKKRHDMTWEKMISQTSPLPETLKLEIHKRFFDRDIYEGFINQN